MSTAQPPATPPVTLEQAANGLLTGLAQPQSTGSTSAAAHLDQILKHSDIELDCPTNLLPPTLQTAYADLSASSSSSETAHASTTSGTANSSRPSSRTYGHTFTFGSSFNKPTFGSFFGQPSTLAYAPADSPGPRAWERSNPQNYSLTALAPTHSPAPSNASPQTTHHTTKFGPHINGSGFSFASWSAQTSPAASTPGSEASSVSSTVATSYGNASMSNGSSAPRRRMVWPPHDPNLDLHGTLIAHSGLTDRMNATTTTTTCQPFFDEASRHGNIFTPLEDLPVRRPSLTDHGRIASAPVSIPTVSASPVTYLHESAKSTEKLDHERSASHPSLPSQQEQEQLVSLVSGALTNGTPGQQNHERAHSSQSAHLSSGIQGRTRSYSRSSQKRPPDATSLPQAGHASRPGSRPVTPPSRAYNNFYHAQGSRTNGMHQSQDDSDHLDTSSYFDAAHSDREFASARSSPQLLRHLARYSALQSPAITTQLSSGSDRSRSNRIGHGDAGSADDGDPAIQLMRDLESAVEHLHQQLSRFSDVIRYRGKMDPSDFDDTWSVFHSTANLLRDRLEQTIVSSEQRVDLSRPLKDVPGGPMRNLRRVQSMLPIPSTSPLAAANHAPVSPVVAPAASRSLQLAVSEAASEARPVPARTESTLSRIDETARASPDGMNAQAQRSPIAADLIVTQQAIDHAQAQMLLQIGSRPDESHTLAINPQLYAHAPLLPLEQRALAMASAQAVQSVTTSPAISEDVARARSESQQASNGPTMAQLQAEHQLSNQVLAVQHRALRTGLPRINTTPESMQVPISRDGRGLSQDPSDHDSEHLLPPGTLTAGNSRRPSSASTARQTPPPAVVRMESVRVERERGETIEWDLSTALAKEHPNPISDELKRKLDAIFEHWLQGICDDLDAKDEKGDNIHQPLMLKKLQKIDESGDYRPFKFRIQAFTSSFSRAVYDAGLSEADCPMKTIKVYLWAQPFIARFNEEGKKCKSRGNHIWTVDAKKMPQGGWQFRAHERHIVIPSQKTLRSGDEWSWEPRIWDQQNAPLGADWSASILPSWVRIVAREDSSAVVDFKGVVPSESGRQEFLLRASFEEAGQTYSFERAFALDVAVEEDTSKSGSNSASDTPDSKYDPSMPFENGVGRLSRAPSLAMDLGEKTPLPTSVSLPDPTLPTFAPAPDLLSMDMAAVRDQMIEESMQAQMNAQAASLALYEDGGPLYLASEPSTMTALDTLSSQLFAGNTPGDQFATLMASQFDLPPDMQQEPNAAPATSQLQ
ncbi:uncharacterized protein L969DRAFT_55287 [Mixia osmundae IAM 14324]|uniref:Uncharacterized protein n=1 Tax=Mixia osmundae (strain CBS 9802 / IAM 14324 / JCM 22182 / KY 12970) TaxID=764103 RepID=G7DV52_MIXOS|nr:uncharacterized protein L969DRAFT_55287 [Mixia osmundae IAM 14324]KEI36321.1 hypothetical protein L969DRAFT_55287 [Mixia osmundae IAM 14324]GAA94462.1 hypothetical protein E5Q_01114 [Mixia osmundae IAM 14324]